MRLVSFHTEEGPAAAIQLGEELVPACALGAPTSMRTLLEQHDAAQLRELGRRAHDAQERVALAAARLCAPVADPQKIVCLGLNYRDHAAETGQEIPAAPMWFAKFANSLRGSGAEIVLPAAHARATSTTRPSSRS